MFLETSEVYMSPNNFCWIIRNYAASGILKDINGLILAKLYNNVFWKEYDDILLQVIRDEEGLKGLPNITGMDFGDTCPTFTIPYGVNAEINCGYQTFSIIENAVND